jgi:hypothetical protein
MLIFTLCLFFVLKKWIPNYTGPLNITKIESDHNIQFPVIIPRELEPWEIYLI